MPVREGVPGARAALPRRLPAQYSASAGGGHDRVRDGSGWIAAAFAHARHPPTHRARQRAQPSLLAAACERTHTGPIGGDVGHPHAAFL